MAYNKSYHKNALLKIVKEKRMILQVDATEVMNRPTNVISMNDCVKINSHQLDIMEYKNQRVITFQDIDRVHERTKGTARKRFNDNKKRFIENVDYFIVKPSDIQKSENRTSGISSVNNAGTYFITESGYLMLVKSFKDNIAWKVQRKLVDSYFKLKEISTTPEVREVLPQMNFDTLDMFEVLVKEMKNQRNKIMDQDNKIIELESKFNAMKNALG